MDRKDFVTDFDFNAARFTAIHRGELQLKYFPPPVRIKILMVADGYPGNFLNITYGRLYFSLSAVVDALTNNPEPWVKFDITKAHRQTDPLGAADVETFRFTQAGFDINTYDQVWFFGARDNENDTQRLSDAELAIVARWMDERQGGVFATGDHADLGASLCSRIPRVRAMRRWTPAQGVPVNFGMNRHDTLLPGTDGIYQFSDESDDQPMPIEPTMFALPSYAVFQERSAPHPLLCGTSGIINVLPDHPHEGEVIEPVSLTNTFTFPGYAGKPEFPPRSDGSGLREKAHVVATAGVTARVAAQDTNKGACNSKRIGVIGAYNGHASGVGRVAVDSTWHHWFDVNLIGRPTGVGEDVVDPVSPGSAKAQGFLYSAAGRAEYDKIKNYFRNVALWLNAPTRQDQLFFRATWRIVFLYPLVEKLHVKMPVWVLGGFALDAIGRMAGQCTVRTWLHDRLTPLWRERFFLPRLDPCFTCPPIDVLEQVLMGAVVRELITVQNEFADKAAGVAEADAAKAVATGLTAGVREFSQMLEQSNKRTLELAKQLQSVPAFEVSAKQFIATNKVTAKVSATGKGVAKPGQRKPVRK